MSAGPKVWIPSKVAGWTLADFLQDLGDGTVLVKHEENEKKIPKTEAFRSDISHFALLDDLCSMNYLHEAPLLDTLRRRFYQDVIYTSAGDVLISVNPYKAIRGLYENPVSFLDVPEDGEVSVGGVKPHVYQVANRSLLQMMHGKRLSMDPNTPVNQSVVVSGESGAGKTEASKHVMNFLIAADKEIQRPASSSVVVTNEEDKLGDAIRDVLVKSNIIFESFGNAKTLRNDNSSRFGKYIKLQYSDDNKILSAFTETFLLEKSRLMSVGANERTYHIFYQLFHPGSSNRHAQLRQKLHLGDASQFRILQDSEGKVMSSGQDELLEELESSLQAIGCSPEEIDSLWAVLASLLHLGNLACYDSDVKAPAEVDAPETDAAQSSMQHLDGNVRIHSPTIALSALAQLLGVTPEMFASRLTTQRVKVSTRRSVTIKRLNIVDVNNNVAALIKWMYSCLFSWLVSKVNYAHCSVGGDSPSMASRRAVKFIGILDIFGFEILQSNSFEQLCINYTNERLQQQFNAFVFDREQEIYRSEGLDWQSISYRDNQHVIDLIGKKPLGLLCILEEQGMLNRGSADEGALYSAFNSTHDKKHVAYERSRFNDNRFTVHHFAGDVTYTIAGMLEKNNDSLQEDLMELMVCSSNVFIHNAIVCVGSGDVGNVGEEGYVAPLPLSKIVQTAGGSLSMAASAPGRPSTAGGEGDVTKKIAATGRRGSLVSGGGAMVAAAAMAAAGGGHAASEVSSKKLATFVTVSFQFRSQLDILINTLKATSPHYIKCIKPNPSKVFGVFDGQLVLEQLRYSGALEVVRIRQEGYPVCLQFPQFYEMFEILAYRRGWAAVRQCSAADAKQYTTTLCGEHLQAVKDFQVGHQKVFLKSDAFEAMHRAVETFLGKKVRRFQGLVRKRIAMRRFGAAKRGIITLQNIVRMRICVKRFQKMLAIRRAEEQARRELEKAEREAQEERERREREERERCEAQERAFRERIINLHSAAARGDYAAVVAGLTANPQDYAMRDTFSSGAANPSLLMSACLGGSLQLIRYFSVSRDELLQDKDSEGDSVLHYLMRGAKESSLDIVRHFIDILCRDETDETEVTASLDKVRPLSTKISTVSASAVISGSSAASGQKKNTKAAPAPSGPVELRAGWLQKRGESQIWRRRFVRLTSHALMYFRSPRDKLPRDTLLLEGGVKIEKCTMRENAIEVFVLSGSKQKKRERVSLMADTEREIQIWTQLIKVAGNVSVPPLRPPRSKQAASETAPSDASIAPLRMLLREKVTQWVRAVNKDGENAMHVVIRQASSRVGRECADASLLSEDSLLSLSLLLLSLGCPYEAPLSLARQSMGGGGEGGLRTGELASLLARYKGALDRADEAAEMGGSRAALQLMEHYQSLEGGDASGETSEELTPAPPLVHGFHYLSVLLYHIEVSPDFSLGQAGSKMQLLVTPLNPAGGQVSAPQRCSLFAQRTAPVRLLLMAAWHLPFPLDNLEDRGSVRLQLRGDAGEVLGCASLPLLRDSLTSGPMKLPLLTNTDVGQVGGSVHIEVLLSKRG